jgi:hypothetical protein
MSPFIELKWREKVDAVRSGHREPLLNSRVRFIYLENPSVFISDAATIDHVLHARKHNHPFLLIGAPGTGKTVFPQLVVRTQPKDKSAVRCIAEQVPAGNEGEAMEKFFGENGVVERHPKSLIYTWRH